MSIKEARDFFLEQLRKSENDETRICIKRKKHFAGALIPYYCVFGAENKENSMKIISLVENNTRSELKAKHGLSL